MSSNVRGAIATSLVIQGLGSLSPFVTILVLARLAGPETQGVFSTFKTWVDLVSSVIVFGFPQAFVYLLNKNMASKGDLLNASLLYVGGTTVCVAPVAAYGVISGYNVLPNGHCLVFYSLLLALGVGAVVLHRLVRAIYLTIDDGFLFSLITSAPAFFLLVAMAIAANFIPFNYDVAFFVAGVLTCLATVAWVRRIVVETPAYTFGMPRLPKRALTKQSAHTFLQSISFTLQPVLTIYLLQANGGGVTDTAYFTSATIIIAAVNVFFGIVSPILFNRWSASLDDGLVARIQKVSDRVALVFLVVGVAAVPLYGVLVPLVFGSDYTAAVPGFQIASYAMAPVAFTRTIASAIHAAGRPDVNTASCVVRLSMSVAVQFGLSQSGVLSPLGAAITAWAIAEWLAAIYLRETGRRMLRWTQ